MWTNRFGALTAVRYPVPTNTFAATGADRRLKRNLLANLDPAAVGLAASNRCGPQALAAANQAQDFGELFLSFRLLRHRGRRSSWMAAAVSIRLGTADAPRWARCSRWGCPVAWSAGFCFREGAVLAFLGGVLGVAGGLGYAWAMMRGVDDGVGATRWPVRR
jgi:hypothetical protein